MISRKLQSFLDENQVRYVTIAHSRAYTAQEIAALVHVPGKNLVKVVMVEADGRPWMVAMDSNHRVNLQRLKEAIGANEVRIEREAEFQELFEDCEVGAMPPFGELYGLPMVADGALWEDREIVFNGGTHSEVVKMAFVDWERLMKPQKALLAARP